MPLFPAPSVLSWMKVVVPYTSLQTAALTNSVLLYTLPTNGILHYGICQITTAFSGTTTLTLSIGTAGNNVKYVAASSALATATINGVAISQPTPESSSSTTAINLYAIATVSNLSSLTQGSASCYLLVSQLT